MFVSVIVKFIRSVITYFVLSIYTFYAEHIRACFDQFDSIVECSVDEGIAPFQEQIARIRAERSRGDKSKRKYFFLGFFVFFSNACDSAYHLYLNDWVYDNINSPVYEIFSHQMYPKQFWYHGDMIIFVITCWHLILFLDLWLNSWLDNRYYMLMVHQVSDDSTVLLVNGKEWDPENTKTVCEYRQRSKQTMKVGMFITFTFLQGYFTWFWKYKGTKDLAMMPFGWKHIWQFWIFLPPFLWYCQVGAILTFYHFFIASRYVMIKQKFALDKMDKLIDAIKHAKNEAAAGECYRQFLHINELLAYQLTEIRGYNKFWSILLSCHFGCDLVLFEYMLYSALFIEASAQELTYFYWFMTELCILIFSVIYRCSAVDNYNDLCYKRNVRICILFQLKFKLTPQRMANIETISTNKNFSRCCFRLKNNYRLDSSAFNLAMYIMSTFFLTMCRKKSKLAD